VNKTKCRILYTGDAQNNLLWEEWALAFYEKGWDVSLWGELLPAHSLPFPIKGSSTSASLPMRMIRRFITAGIPFSSTLQNAPSGTWRNLTSLKHWLFTLYSFTYSREFEKTLNQEPYDLIHLHYLYQPATLAFLNIKQTLPPMIYSTWGSDLFIEPTRSRLRYEQFCRLLSLVHTVHTESQLQAHYLKKTFHYRGNIVVHSWGIHIKSLQKTVEQFPSTYWRKKLRLSDSTVLIVSARKLEKNYRIHLLIDILRIFKQRYPSLPFHFLIASHGSQYSSLLEHVREAKMEKDVTFTGYLPPALYLALLAQADLYMQSPVSDGISQTLLQVMALKTLCLTSAAGDNASLIEHGKNGFLFQGESPDRIAPLLKEIFTLSSQTKDEITRKAYQTVRENHSQEKRLAFFSRLYKDLAG